MSRICHVSLPYIPKSGHLCHLLSRVTVEVAVCNKMLATNGSSETISFVKWPYLIPCFWDQSGSSMFPSTVRNHHVKKLPTSEDMTVNMDCQENQDTDTHI